MTLGNPDEDKDKSEEKGANEIRINANVLR